MSDSLKHMFKVCGAAFLSGLVANILYLGLTQVVEDITFHFWIVALLALVSILLIVCLYAWMYRSILSQLGIVKLHEKVEETTKEGLEQAVESYQWLGTSAYYVLCESKGREKGHDKIIRLKRRTKFMFTTVDDECLAAVREQAEWEGELTDNMTRRIRKVKESIAELENSGIKISWNGHFSPPTFRVVIINGRTVLVSFYESGKLGKDCAQIQLDVDGLLGRWFVQYYERHLLAIRRLHIEHKATSILWRRANIPQPQLVKELQKICPNECGNFINQVVNDMISLDGAHNDRS